MIPSVTPQLELDGDDYWERLQLVGQVPAAADPGPVDPIAPVAKYQIQPLADWVTEAGTGVVYDGSVVVGLPTPVGAALRDVSPTNGGRVTGRSAANAPAELMGPSEGEPPCRQRASTICTTRERPTTARSGRT